jgi:hypothetical protein
MYANGQKRTFVGFIIRRSPGELVCSARLRLIAVGCTASHTQADGLDPTTVRDPNTRAALLTFAVK